MTAPTPHADLPGPAATLYRLLANGPTTRLDAALAAVATTRIPGDEQDGFDSLDAAGLVAVDGDGWYALRGDADPALTTDPDQEATDRSLQRRTVDYLLAAMTAIEQKFTASHATLPRTYFLDPPPALVPDDATLAWGQRHLPLILEAATWCYEHGHHPQSWQLADATWPVVKLCRVPELRLALQELGLQAARAAEDPAAIGRFLTSLSATCAQCGDKERALLLNAQALAHFEELRSPLGQAQALNDRAKFELEGDIEQAEDLFRRARVLREQNGDLRAAALSLQGIGRCRLNAGDADAALAAFEQAHGSLVEAQDPFDAAATLAYSARALAVLGHTAKAVAACDQAAAQMLAIPSRFGEGLALEALGEIHRDAGQSSEALAAFREAARAVDGGDLFVVERISASLAALDAA
jgi:tetratricopeptide (TPR) repeat protein